MNLLYINFVEHFKEELFTNRLSEELDRRLKRDEVGISLFPTKHATLFQMTKQLKDLKVSEANERWDICQQHAVGLQVNTGRDIFWLIMNLPFMFYSSNKITVFLLLQRWKDAMESLESTISSTSAEPKRKHRRKATKLPSRSSTPQPSQDEPMQAVEAMDVSGPVEFSDVGSPCLLAN